MISELITWVYYRPLFWLRNRFFDRTHALTSRQLQRGQYHEIDTRILYCLFDTLTDYVEGELAWLHLVMTKSPGRARRNPAAGLARLEWESSLTDDDGSPTSQAKAAMEVLALYTWWTQERLKRANPNALEDVDDIIKLEQQYEAEDQAMLHRLIDVRSYLWT